jgi:hypothetical protein
MSAQRLRPLRPVVLILPTLGFCTQTVQATLFVAGLAGDASAFDGGSDVEFVAHFHFFQRLTNDHACGFAAEEFIGRL